MSAKASADYPTPLSLLTELVEGEEKLTEHAMECNSDPCSTCFVESAAVEGLFAKARIYLRQWQQEAARSDASEGGDRG